MADYQAVFLFTALISLLRLLHPNVDLALHYCGQQRCVVNAYLFQWVPLSLSSCFYSLLCFRMSFAQKRCLFMFHPAPVVCHYAADSQPRIHPTAFSVVRLNATTQRKDLSVLRLRPSKYDRILASLCFHLPSQHLSDRC